MRTLATRNRFLAAAALAGLVSASSAMAAVSGPVSLDFETPGQVIGNFRAMANSTTSPDNYSAGYRLLQSSNTAPANNYLNGSIQWSAGACSFIYDTTPADATASTQDMFSVPVGSTLTVTSNALFHKASGGLGVYFVDPSNEGSGYLALFSVDSSGTNDNFRFATNAAPNSAGAGTLAAGSIAANSVNSGIDVVPAADFATFGTITAKYSVLSSSSFSLSLTANSTTSTITYTSVTPLQNVEVAFRGYADNSSFALDNVSVSVPEPASLGLLGLVSLGMLRRRWA